MKQQGKSIASINRLAHICVPRKEDVTVEFAFTI
jgi:hypothetical protein